MEVSGHIHSPVALTPGWGLQSRSRYGGEEKNSQPPPGIEPPIIQAAAQYYTTELSQLHIFKG
jgi:hypothetical protein